MNIAHFLWGNPYLSYSKEYEKYDSLRKTRNHMMLISWLNFGSCFRDYGKDHLSWMPAWSNYVFILGFVCCIILLFWQQYKMRQILVDKKKCELVGSILDE